MSTNAAAFSPNLNPKPKPNPNPNLKDQTHGQT